MAVPLPMLLLLVLLLSSCCSLAEEQDECATGWAGEDCDRCAAGHGGDLCLPVAAATLGSGGGGGGRVHVLATICGGDYVAKCLPMLRSLLYHRSTPLTLHIIADRPARRELSRAFADGWGAPALEVDYIHAEKHVARVHDAFPANFFTNMGACSTLRMFAPEILPSVEKAIIMDTGDVVLMDDVAELWGHFENFDADDLFGASKEQARWYYRLSVRLSRIRPCPPAACRSPPAGAAAGASQPRLRCCGGATRTWAQTLGCPGTRRNRGTTLGGRARSTATVSTRECCFYTWRGCAPPAGCSLLRSSYMKARPSDRTERSCDCLATTVSRMSITWR